LFVAIQAPVEPITVYVVLLVGVITTDEPLVLIDIGGGFQLYDDAPLAVNVAEVIGHMVLPIVLATDIFSNDNTLMVATAILKQELLSTPITE
jgi:hypothetical protein